MKKKIVIESCNSCPYQGCCYDDGYIKKEYYCLARYGKDILDSDNIPDWCPLENEES